MRDVSTPNYRATLNTPVKILAERLASTGLSTFFVDNTFRVWPFLETRRKRFVPARFNQPVPGTDQTGRREPDLHDHQAHCASKEPKNDPEAVRYQKNRKPIARVTIVKCQQGRPEQPETAARPLKDLHQTYRPNSIRHDGGMPGVWRDSHDPA